MAELYVLVKREIIMGQAANLCRWVIGPATTVGQGNATTHYTIEAGPMSTQSECLAWIENHGGGWGTTWNC